MAKTIISVGTKADKVNAIIENAASGDIVEFSAGAHVFDETIVIRRDDITVKGAGEAQTQIKFRFDDNGDGRVDTSEGASGFEILGFKETSNYVRKADRGEVIQAISAGQTKIKISDTGNLADGTLAVGDVIHIQQQNTNAYLDEIGGCAPGTDCRETALNRYFREFTSTIVEVDSKSGTVSLADPIPYAMNPNETQIEMVELTDVRRDVSLSDLSITFEIFDPKTGAVITPDANDFSNTQGGFLSGKRPGKAAVYVEGSTGATVENISVTNAPAQGFAFRNSINLAADNLAVDGSFNKGVGGHGYGVDIYETSNSSFTNLDIFDVRHAVLFSSWNAETGNTVQIDSTNRDINFHGGPDLDNMITVDSAILQYGDSPQVWQIVSNGGRVVHQQTDIYGLGNTVVFKTASGSERDEVIYASAGGANLRGNGGDDVLVAGAGADVLDGGQGRDTVSYVTANRKISVDLRGVKDSDNGAAGDRLTSIENVKGSAFGDVILGSDKANTVVSWGGGDIVYGRGGNDTISGGRGSDELHGQRGDDTLSGGWGRDVFFFDEGSGSDVIRDFRVGRDKVDFSRHSSVDDLDDLDIAAGPDSAIVTFADGEGGTAQIDLIGIGDGGVTDDFFIF